MPECRLPIRNFSGQWGGFMELGHLNKQFLKNKKRSRVFSPRHSLNYILNGKFNSKMEAIRASLFKVRTLFHFEKEQGGFPLSLVVRLWLWLNMHQHPWLSLNILVNAWITCFDRLFWLCQVSKYAWSSYMFNRLLKMLWVLNVPGFWI